MGCLMQPTELHAPIYSTVDRKMCHKLNPTSCCFAGDIWGALGNSCGFADCSSVSRADRSPQLLVAFPAGGRAEDEEVS